MLRYPPPPSRGRGGQLAEQLMHDEMDGYPGSKIQPSMIQGRKGGVKNPSKEQE